MPVNDDTTEEQHPGPRRKARFAPGDNGWSSIPPSQRGWVELADPGYPGAIRLRIRGDLTRARPHTLDLSAGQARELAALLVAEAGPS